MNNDEVAAYWENNAATWARHAAAGYDIYRDHLNTPAFLAMLPDVSGLSGLDIGCGDGANTRQVARCGAKMRAIDISPTFIEHARKHEAHQPRGIHFEVGDGTKLPFATATFDFATAFMCLMDMPDQAAALREAHRVLKPGGFLQFSILHPCFVPPHRKVLRDADGVTRAVEVAGYFDRIDGQLDTFWFSGLPQIERERSEPFRIPRFHRTLSEWVGMINAAGLTIEQMAEPSASEELAAAQPVVADTRVVPIFLLFRVRKAA